MSGGLTGCDLCDDHGPYLPGFFSDNTEWRELHRAFHDIGRACSPRLVAIIRWTNERLDKVARL